MKMVSALRFTRLEMRRISVIDRQGQSPIFKEIDKDLLVYWFKIDSERAWTIIVVMIQIIHKRCGATSDVSL